MSKASNERWKARQTRNNRLGLSAKVLQGLLAGRGEVAPWALVSPAVELADLLIAEVDRTTPKAQPDDPEAVLPKED